MGRGGGRSDFAAAVVGEEENTQKGAARTSLRDTSTRLGCGESSVGADKPTRRAAGRMNFLSTRLDSRRGTRKRLCV